MIRKRPNAGPLKYVLLVAFLIPCWAWAAQTTASPKQMHEDAEGFRDFSEGVLKYVKVHNSVEARLRQVKRADAPENIDAHQRELASGIRAARSRARRGDVFTSDASEAIRHVILSVFQGTQAGAARATIQQGEPLRHRVRRVNGTYVDTAPYTTVPPTLLMSLPPLPDILAYRIVGRDLVLLDVTANLVVDFLPQAIP